MAKCEAIARINRIGNGFNGHRGNYTCKAEGTVMAAYTITTEAWVEGRFTQTSTTEMKPACAKHAGNTPNLVYRRSVTLTASK